jgi:hypothetical protein
MGTQKTPKVTTRLVEVSFEGVNDLGAVMIPVTDRRLSKRRRSELAAQARQLQQYGRFVQADTNPKFLSALARDFFHDLAPVKLERHVTPHVISTAGAAEDQRRFS